MGERLPRNIIKMRGWIDGGGNFGSTEPFLLFNFNDFKDFKDFIDFKDSRAQRALTKPPFYAIIASYFSGISV